MRSATMQQLCFRARAENIERISQEEIFLVKFFSVSTISKQSNKIYLNLAKKGNLEQKYKYQSKINIETGAKELL